MKSTAILVFLLLFTGAFFLQAEQLGTVQGTVRVQPDEFLPGAVVTLNGPSVKMQRYATTDDKGNYIFKDVPAGRDYVITVRMMGYQTLEKTGIEVRPGQSTRVDITLNKVSYEGKHETNAAAPVFDSAVMAESPPLVRSKGNGTIGLAVGGANDIENFRKNIENDYLPMPTDITYEGIYYDYYFDTGQTKPCNRLFCPSYSIAISKDPLSKKTEYYMQVGLNSGIKESDFKRKKLNLVIVLDISGSMGSAFNRYYYDNAGEKKTREEDPEFISMNKMSIANHAVAGLLKHLNSEDNFGMVLFNDAGYLFMPMTNMGDVDINELTSRILRITSSGGTNMSQGMGMGISLFKDLVNANPGEYENRIIFITDAMPNLGDTSEFSLLGMTRRVSNNRIYSTFIGVGVDFNTKLVEVITKIRGANYYSVHSGKSFLERMDDEFEYMVTPLVFNLSLVFQSKGFEIEKVYGSPEADLSTGELMKVNTLFPSKREGGETKGGIVILKLKKLSEKADIRLKTSYENREGRTDGDEQSIVFDISDKDHYDNNGIRKGILLARYVNLMRNWINDEITGYSIKKPAVPSIDRETGILLAPDIDRSALGKWERQSIPLQVNLEYKSLIEIFYKYFEKEAKEINDESLSREMEIMKKLIEYKE